MTVLKTFKTDFQIIFYSSCNCFEGMHAIALFDSNGLTIQIYSVGEKFLPVLDQQHLSFLFKLIYHYRRQ